MDPYIGEIRLFAGNYAPKGWALCQGQLMSIVQNTALFSILGVQYGGDGKTTFALPNMSGRAPLHQGAGPGLTPRTIGETDGSETVTLLESEIPSHTHAVNAVSNTPANQSDPTGHLWGKPQGRSPAPIYTDAPDTTMNVNAIGVTGGSQPHNNMQPYVALQFIIALEGVYPPKP